MAAASSASGFNMGGLLESLEKAVERKPTNAFNMSSMLDSLSSASDQAAAIQKATQRKPRRTPEDEAIDLKMGHLKEQLDKEHGKLTRAVRKIGRPANAEERAKLDAAIAAYQANIAEITEQLKNPNSIRNSIRRGRSIRRNPNGRRSMSMSRSRSPKRTNSMNNGSRSPRRPRHGGATRKRSNK